MKIHHDKHHATYAENLNEALSDHPQLQGRSLEMLLSAVETLPEGVRNVIRNNGGGIKSLFVLVKNHLVTDLPAAFESALRGERFLSPSLTDRSRQ